MVFKKEVMSKEVWVYEYAEGKIIPLEQVKLIVQSIFLAVLAYFAYNYGWYGAEEYVKISAYLGTPHCDAYGHCLSYTLEQQGSQLVWVAKDVSSENNQNYINDNDYNNTWQR